MEDILIQIEELEARTRKILVQSPELEVFIRAYLQKIIKRLSKEIGKS